MRVSVAGSLAHLEKLGGALLEGAQPLADPDKAVVIALAQSNRREDPTDKYNSTAKDAHKAKYTGFWD